MLYKPSFGDRQLAESFYQALFNRFYDSVDRQTQELLRECQFGLAPSPTGVKTFFILTPDLEQAQNLIEQIDGIINGVMAIMVGVHQTAICIAPPDGGDGPRQQSGQLNPRYMMAKIFPHPPQDDEELG
ncbi:hypothetical protein J0895_02480 [Phormidium pseudopriestleyi FRX01]|uniref:Uncharacterized protein n=1 Tax=Phormidium pseudopriestleyi FRX01 TaxID=1759528 RepID=A0ABS3FLK2_9CYAN|nr:hypothetical protein [Phormidium pseudopriestleyi]MBO0347988.1 hypothetical protein [Phormidium pseudopriestleyi FRX01]